MRIKEVTSKAKIEVVNFFVALRNYLADFEKSEITRAQEQAENERKRLIAVQTRNKKKNYMLNAILFSVIISNIHQEINAADPDPIDMVSHAGYMTGTTYKYRLRKSEIDGTKQDDVHRLAIVSSVISRELQRNYPRQRLVSIRDSADGLSYVIEIVGAKYA